MHTFFLNVSWNRFEPLPCANTIWNTENNDKKFMAYHGDVINKWKHFPPYWPFVRGIRRSPVNSPHKDQLRGALMFSLICVWINGWVNNRDAGDLRRYRSYYDFTIMLDQNRACCDKFMIGMTRKSILIGTLSLLLYWGSNCYWTIQAIQVSVRAELWKEIYPNNVVW